MSNTYLQTPPATPVQEFYSQFNISVTKSGLMPSASKIKHGSPFSWEDTKFIVKSNQLEVFARSEEETTKYHEFKAWLKANELSINEYLLSSQLEWKDEDIRDQTKEYPQEYDVNHAQDLILFNPNDVKILPNKFPYYFDTNVRHICIWSKLKVPADKESVVGDISPRTRRLVHRYLERTFVKRGVSWDQILWFKNWVSLQSVRAVSHFHVLLRDVDDALIEELMGNSGEMLDLEDYRELL
ncbi:N-acetylglucosamine-induced protein 1 [Spathaspora sp. JA1]|nr:N-acetylglucosamine-induced protein 1 [Spathaspora sp. JA1]